jgi:hypothetical protein
MQQSTYTSVGAHDRQQGGKSKMDGMPGWIMARTTTAGFVGSIILSVYHYIV